MASYMRAIYADGHEEVVRVGPKSLVAFERQYSVSILDYNRKRTLEQTYWPVWHALREVGKEDREFDDWLGDMDKVSAEIDTPDNPVGDEAVNPEPDPTRKVQPSET